MFHTVKFNQLSINFDALAIQNKEKNKACKPIVEYLDSTKAPFKKRTFENYMAFNNSLRVSAKNAPNAHPNFCDIVDAENMSPVALRPFFHSA